MKHLILSTAGHIDHGKTKLVEALTGKNTLHHKEEKQRGITIDLGYAHLSSCDMTISIIDVPGHEDYLKNSICGILNSDFSLLVVSAKDGIQRQTLEHLKVIESIAAPFLLLVITKTDLAEDSQIEKVKKESLSLLRASSLKHFDILSVAYDQPLSIKRIRDILFEKGREVASPKAYPPIFTIDNAFHVKGHGCVVSGNLLSGRFTVQDRVNIYPAKIQTRIKQIQQDSLPMQEALARGRYAFNLATLSKKDVKRGMLLSGPSTLSNSFLLDVLVSKSSLNRKTIPFHRRVRIYLGTLATHGKVIPLYDKEGISSDYQIVQLRLQEEVNSFIHAPFLLQDTASNCILGGGYVLHPCPRKKSSLPKNISSLSPESLLVYLLIFDAHFISRRSLEEVFFLEGTWIETMTKTLLDKKWIIVLSGDTDGANTLYVDKIFFEKLGQKISSAIKFAFDSGKNSISLSSLLSTFSYVDGRIVLYFVQNSSYRVQNGLICLSQKASSLQIEKKKRLCRLFSSAKEPLSLRRLLKEEEISLSFLYEEMRPYFVNLSQDYLCSISLLDSYQSFIKGHFQQKDKLFLEDFKAYSGLSRKMSILVLEYFDAKRITKRFENYRIKSYN